MFRSDNFINVLIGKTTTIRSAAGLPKLAVLTSVGATAAAGTTTPIRIGEVLMFNGSTDLGMDDTNGYVNMGPTTRFVQGTADGRIIATPVINAHDITSVSTIGYTAAAQQITNITTNNVATVVGNVYTLRVKPIHDTAVWSEQQNQRIYAKKATATTRQDLLDAFANAINADAGSDVWATTSNVAVPSGVTQSVGQPAANILRLTGKTLTFELGYFKNNEVRFEVSVDEALSPIIAAITVATAATLGSGTYKQVAEMEWFALGYEGIKNRMTVPIPTGRELADSAINYSTIAIEFNLRDQYNVVSGAKPGKGMVYIFQPNGLQGTNPDLQDQFTQWMAFNGLGTKFAIGAY